METNNLYNLDALIGTLRFHYPDFRWIRYSDHIASYYRNLDIKISIYRPEGMNESMFLINYFDKYFKINDRDVKLLKFNQLLEQLQSFQNMTRNEQMLLDLDLKLVRTYD